MLPYKSIIYIKCIGRHLDMAHCQAADEGNGLQVGGWIQTC